MLRPCTPFARYGDKSTDLGARDLGPHSDSTFSSTFCLGQVFYLLGLSLKKKKETKEKYGSSPKWCIENEMGKWLWNPYFLTKVVFYYLL